MLKDRVIVVTGGSGLLGKPMVEYCKERGAHIINADVDVERCLEKGVFYCDVTCPGDIDDLLSRVMERYGRIDGLVNNAYPRTADWGAAFEAIPFDSWQKNIEMQLNSCFYICQQTLKYMEQQHSGAIINIASIYGVVGNDFTVYEGTGGMTSPAAYAAIKGGIINFTRYLASYYGHKNIRINCISPGGIFNHQHPEFVKNYEAKVPMRRMGMPHEIAPVAGFLLSTAASYITGQNIIVDGGWTAI